jgi:hypothetical protein
MITLKFEFGVVSCDQIDAHSTVLAYLGGNVFESSAFQQIPELPDVERNLPV